ncbi:hypothetical protein LIER_41440 [Lithospermum erythrorhizon]|uniref:Mitochondrial protein n=1 Tax=Lithospermum erythrorhizon TaxID=34254 RepID=A0AAV3R9C5_LITER
MAKVSSAADHSPLFDPSSYRCLIGALQYLAFTSPDITYVVNQASQTMHNPSTSDKIAAKRILRYLAGTITYGYCVLLGDNIISWSLKKQPTVSRSSTEAEYLAYNPVLHSRSKDIALDYHFVREKVSLGDLIVKHVPTQLQLADAFTKPLSTAKFLVAFSNFCLIKPA